MKRVIFDTSIYGRIIENGELAFVSDSIASVLTNYGSVVVRQELKSYEGKRVVFHEGKVRKFRALLLEAYDALVKKTYDVDGKTDRLAEEYFVAYEKLGGKELRGEIINDFMVVATAAIHELEIVYTEEKEGSTRTMRSPEVLKAYEIINELNSLKLPQFKSYQELKATLKSRRWFA